MTGKALLKTMRESCNELRKNPEKTEILQFLSAKQHRLPGFTQKMNAHREEFLPYLKICLTEQDTISVSH